MKEFRLVIYMNAPDSRGFFGGRGAASPLAYYCHLANNKRKNRKVFLGGSIVLKGLGKYHSFVKDAFGVDSNPVKLPLLIRCDHEQIIISDKAFVYQNDDPLLTTSESGIYWKAKIEAIGPRENFSDEEGRFTLDAVKIGLKEYMGKFDETRDKELVVLASRLDKMTHPIDKDNSPQLMVYGGSHRERRFWGNNGKPTSRRRNAFAHMTRREWQRFDKSAKAKEVNIRKLIDSQIKHCHIRESLVHEMLKIMFASKGWWVNYELPIRGKEGGRIDFLIKWDHDDDWRLIEVKLDDNPTAVTQLRGYIEAIKDDVRRLGEDSHFWLLWNGRKRCKKIKGVIVCGPGDRTVTKARNAGYDVWTYKYNVERKSSQLGIEVRDATSKKLILKVGGVGSKR